MRFKNFQIWRGRLPHWRADDVTYYVTFRHSRPLDDRERDWLLGALLKNDGRAMRVLICCVLPERSEMIFRMEPDSHGVVPELSKLIEAAKRKTGKKVTKSSGERYAPFWTESYDRIIRDAGELEERWLSILESPVAHELVEDPEEYSGLWVSRTSEI